MGRVVLFDLNSQDPERAASFYSSVFGWKGKMEFEHFYLAYLVDPVGNGIGLIQNKK